MSGEGAVRRRRWPRRLLRVLVVALVVLAALGAGGWFWLRGRLEASLPQLDGKATVPGLGAPASVERDALGVPTVRGSSRLDVARALGFLHGQERFFQMDLLRRGAAGELAALLGAPLVGSDRRLRAHRFREIAGRSLHEASPEIRDLLTGYSDGVNAGLRSLDAPAPEYVLLRTEPVPWKTEDSLLVLSAMFLQLQDSSGGTDRARGLILETLPLELSEFLMPAGTE